MGIYGQEVDPDSDTDTLDNGVGEMKRDSRILYAALARIVSVVSLLRIVEGEQRLEGSKTHRLPGSHAHKLTGSATPSDQ